MVKEPESSAKKTNTMAPLDQLLPNAGGSMFSLARLAMKRAEEIYEGSRPMVDHLPLDKSTTIAFMEIAAGKITLGNGKLKKKSKDVKPKEESAD